MEFSFDALQTANGNYSSLAYHDFIGFNVSRPLPERAFRKTYGLELHKVFTDFSLAIQVFRWSVISLFPVITKTAWVIRKDEILKLQPKATSRSLSYKMRRARDHAASPGPKPQLYHVQFFVEYPAQWDKRNPGHHTMINNRLLIS